MRRLAHERVSLLQKAKQLTAADGHVVLLEYVEENPLLLSRPGEPPFRRPSLLPRVATASC